MSWPSVEAASCRRRTIAFIVGAGASASSGAPTTQELLETVLASFPTQRIAIGIEGKATTTSVPLAALIKEHLVSIYDREVDFELVMACLEEMISYCMPGRVLRAFTQNRPTFESVLEPGMLQAAYQSAIRELVAAFLPRHPQTQEQIKAAESLTRLIRTVATKARVVLSTLNYDTLLDDALPWVDGFVGVPGWDFSQFEPALWLERGRSSHLLMHLHGSMRFGFRPFMARREAAPFGEPVLYHSNCQAADSVFRDSAAAPTADGLLLPATPIIAGGHKSPKLVHNVRPYAYYNATSLHEMLNADALLIIGYGFRDEHVNAWIDEYVRIHPRGPLALITKRTGHDVGRPTEAERFLMKLNQGGQAYDQIYESVDPGERSPKSHGYFGGAYVATAGVPLDSEAECELLHYLFNESRDAGVSAGNEIEAYVGRRAQVLRRDGTTLVGTIKKVGGDRIAVAGKQFARQIRFADIVCVGLAPDGSLDTD